jgi:hypothetical protein
VLPTATPTDRFWALVEGARLAGENCDRVASRLTDTLATLPATAILEFNNEFAARMAESYRWDLWAVAYVANGGASDDGFDYFRGWLITRGRRQFERALVDAPAATVGAPRFGDLECETIVSVAYDAYRRATGEELPRSTVTLPHSPTGKPWTEETIEQVYPGLTARVRRG